MQLDLKKLTPEEKQTLGRPPYPFKYNYNSNYVHIKLERQSKLYTYICTYMYYSKFSCLNLAWTSWTFISNNYSLLPKYSSSGSTSMLFLPIPTGTRPLLNTGGGVMTYPLRHEQLSYLTLPYCGLWITYIKRNFLQFLFDIIDYIMKYNTYIYILN